MKEFWNAVQFVFTAVGGWLGYFLGGCDGLLYALIAFVAIDSVKRGRLSRHLPESIDFPVGRNRKYFGPSCDRDRKCIENSRDFLLHFKRRCEPSGKCRPSGASSATEDQSSIGTVT